MSNEITTTQRKEALDNAVRKLAKQGYKVESQTDFQAIMYKGKRPNHLLHLILTVVTVTAWAIFVWLPLAIFKREKRRIIRVNPYGNVTVRNA